MIERYSLDRPDFSCITCGNTSFDLFYQKDILVETAEEEVFFRQELESCNQCGLVRQFPNDSYSKENLNRYYKYTYRTPLKLNELQPDDPRVKNAEERLAFIESLEVGKTLLEIGFGDGVFLSHAQNNNYNCTGVDPSDGYNYIKQELVSIGVNIVSSTLEDYAGSQLGRESSFDVICLFFVLEHMLTPLPFLEKVLTLLKPDGRLIIEVPDIKMYPNFISETILTFEHVYHYSLQSLENLLVNLNCSLIGQKTDGVSFGFSLFSGFKKCDDVQQPICKTSDIDYFMAFIVRRNEYIEILSNIVRNLRKRRERAKLRVGIYGAGFFANVLVDSCGLNEEMLDYVFDDTPEKIGSSYLGKDVEHSDAIANSDIQVLLILSESFCDQLGKRAKDIANNNALEICCPHSIALSMLGAIYKQ